MGNLPYARNRDYAPLTQVPSGDLNDLQDCCVREWSAISGSALVIADDFLGALDSSKWAGVAVGNAAFIVPSAGLGAGNVAGRIGGAPSAGQSWSITCPNFAAGMALGVLPWRFAARCTCSLGAGNLAASKYYFGLRSTVAAEEIYFRALGTDTNIQCINGADGGASHDSGVTASAGWKLYEIRWDGATLAFLIEGVVVYSTQANTPNLTTPQLQLSATTAMGDPASVDLDVDVVKFWCGR